MGRNDAGIFKESTSELILGSPYILLPVHVHVELAIKNLVIENITEWLIYPHDESTNKYFKTDQGIAYLAYTRYVLGDFMRNSVNRNFPHFKIPRHFPQKCKELLKAESRLVSNVWKIIRLLATYYYPEPLPLVFLEVLKEYDLLFFIFDSQIQSPATKFTTVTNFRKTIQAQNGNLSKFDPFENPFDINKSPFTHKLLKICRLELNKNDEFRQEYNSLVKARQNLVTKILASHPEIRRLESNKKEWRGRKY